MAQIVLKTEERKGISEAENALTVLKEIANSWSKRLEPQKNAVATVSERVRQLGAQGKAKDAEKLASVLAMFVTSIETLDTSNALRSQENKALIDAATTGIRSYGMRIEDERAAKSAMGIAISLQQYSKAVSLGNDEAGIFTKALRSYAKGDLEAGGRNLDEGMGRFFDQDVQRLQAIVNASEVHNIAAKLWGDRVKLLLGNERSLGKAEDDPAITLYKRITRETEEYRKELVISQAFTPEQKEEHAQRVAGWTLATALLNKANDGTVSMAETSTMLSGAEKKRMVDDFRSSQIEFIRAATLALDSSKTLDRSAFKKQMEDTVTELFRERADIVSRWEKFAPNDPMRESLRAITSVQRNMALSLASSEPFEKGIVEAAERNYARILATFFNVSDAKTRTAIYNSSVLSFSFARKLIDAQGQAYNDLASRNRTLNRDLDQEINRDTKASEAYSSLKVGANLGVSMFMPIYGIAYAAYNINEAYEETGKVSKSGVALTIAGAVPILGIGAKITARGMRWANLVKQAEMVVGLAGLGAGSVLGSTDAYYAYRAGRGIDAIMSSFVILFPVAHITTARIRARNPANIVPVRDRPSVRLGIMNPVEANAFDYYWMMVRSEIGGGSTDNAAAEHAKVQAALGKRARSEQLSPEEATALRTYDEAQRRAGHQTPADIVAKKAEPGEPVRPTLLETTRKMSKAEKRVVEDQNKAALERYYADLRAWQEAKRASAGIDMTIPEVQRQKLSDGAKELLRSVDPTDVTDGDVTSDFFRTTATGRVEDLMKALNNRQDALRHGPKQSQSESGAQACDQALIKIYSYKNVRESLTALANDPALNATERNEIAGILNRVDRLVTRAGSGDKDEFMNLNARRGPQENELVTMTDVLERQTEATVAPRRARLRALSNSEIPKAEDSYGIAEAEYQRAKGTNREADAKKKMDDAGQRLTKLYSDRDDLVKFLNMRGVQPLARSEQVFGIEFSAAERDPMIKRLMAGSILPGESYVNIAEAAKAHAINELNIISPRTVVGDAIHVGLSGRIMNSSGAGLESEILSVMRSDEVANEFGQGPQRDAFVKAAKANTVEEALRMMRDGVQVGGRTVTFEPAVIDDIANFVRSARENLAEPFAMIEKTVPEAIKVIDEWASSGAASGRMVGSSFSRDVLGIGHWRERFVAGGGRFVERWPISSQWKRAWEARKAWNASRPGEVPAKIAAAKRMGSQLVVWSAEFAAGYAVYWYGWGRKKDDPFQLDTVEMKARYGIVVPGDLANWANTTNGRAFRAEMPKIYPTTIPEGSTLVKELDRKDVIVRPAKLVEVLADAKVFDSRLGTLNSLLQKRSDGDTSAAEKLAETLATMHIKLDDVDALLSDKKRNVLRIEDAHALKRDDWVSRGIAIRYCDVISELFLRDTVGVAASQNKDMIKFLSDNPYAFLYLWQAYMGGEIPAAMLDDAINRLRNMPAPSIYKYEGSAIAKDKDGIGITDDAKLKAALEPYRVMTQSQGENVETGIRLESFLGRLDTRVANDQNMKKVEMEIIEKYKNQPEAMAAFNAFAPLDLIFDKKRNVIGGEDIYGNPMALADLIAKNAARAPAEILGIARAQGFVGPAMLGDIDPTLRNDNSLALFAARMSTEAGKERQGVTRWIEINREHLGGNGNLSKMLNDMRDACDEKKAAGTPTRTPKEVEDRATRMADTYKERKWWTGRTPAEEDRSKLQGKIKEAKKGSKAALEKGMGEFQQGAKEAERPGSLRMKGITKTEEVVGELKTNPAADKFWEKQIGLSNLVNGQIVKLRNAKAEGQIMGKALEKFGNEDKMDGDIKSELFRVLSDPKAQWKDWGLDVKGSGASMEVGMTRKKDTVERNIETYILDYVKIKAGIKPEEMKAKKAGKRRSR